MQLFLNNFWRWSKEYEHSQKSLKRLKDHNRENICRGFWDTFMAEETWYPVSWKLQILNSPTMWTSGSEKLSFLQDGWIPCKTLHFILGFLFSNSECEDLCYSILVQYFRHTDANYYYNRTCGADLKITKTITLLISHISVFVVCVQNVAWKGTRRRKIRLFRKPMCRFQLQ